MPHFRAGRLPDRKRLPVANEAVAADRVVERQVGSDAVALLDPRDGPRLRRTAAREHDQARDDRDRTHHEIAFSAFASDCLVVSTPP